MAPVLHAFPRRSAPSALSAREVASSDFQSTPAEAVVVPVAVFVLIFVGAAIASVYKYWQRRNDRDRLMKAATPKPDRKLIPEWLSNWMDSSIVKPLYSPRRGSKRNRDGHNTDFRVDISESASKPGTTGLADENSDIVALRPVSVYLPPYPLTVHDPHDRYPGIRPKPLGVPWT